jgi:regulatory protein
MDQPETPEVPETPTPVTSASMRLKAMDLLARREYSRYELSDKLTTKLALGGEHMDTLEAVLDRLIADGLLSDERFAEALVRSKLHKGQGPRRIAQDLYKRGVSAELASSALQECGADWYELVVAVTNKKYGLEPAVDMKEKARRSRFLQYRGFSAEHIAHALSYKL